MIAIRHAFGSTVLLASGERVEGTVHGASADTAAELGYTGPDAVLEMVRDHDTLHVMLCWLVGAQSHALPARERDTELATLEECAVMAVQKWLRRLDLDRGAA